MGHKRNANESFSSHFPRSGGGVGGDRRTLHGVHVQRIYKKNNFKPRFSNFSGYSSNCFQMEPMFFQKVPYAIPNWSLAALSGI